MAQEKIQLLLEAEARGILPDEKKALLTEARARGLVPGSNNQQSQPEAQTAPPEQELQSALAPTPFPKNLPHADQAEGIDFSNRPARTALMNAADSYGAGIPRRGAAGLDALISKLSGRSRQIMNDAGQLEDQGIGALYNESLGKIDSNIEGLNQANPYSALAGNVAGNVAPGSVFSRLFKGSSGLPIVEKLLQNGSSAARIAGTAARGGLANAGYGQVSQDFDSSISDRSKKAESDFLTGAAVDSGTYAGMGALKFAGSKALPFGRGVLDFAKKLPEKLPFGIGDVVKEGRLEKFASGVDDIAEKAGASNSEVAGRAYADKISDIGKKASEKYHALKGAMLNKFGDGKASPETLRKGIVEELNRITELAADLDPNDKALKSVLEKWQGKLLENPTLRELDDITTTLYNASKKPNANPAFKRLYQVSRENLLGAMDDAAVNAGEKSKSYTSAKKQVESLTGDLADLNAKSAKNPNPKGWAQETGKANVESQIADSRGQLDEVKRIIDSLDSSNELQGAQARESYRAAREEIAKNLNVSSGPVGKLAKKLPSEIVETAGKSGKLDLPEVIDEAISVNPEFADPIKKAIIANIKLSSSDPKKLQAALKAYGSVLPKLLSQDELTALEKLAGTYSRPNGVVVRSGKNLWNKLQGGSSRPGTIEMIPRSVAPLISRDTRQ